MVRDFQVFFVDDLNAADSVEHHKVSGRVRTRFIEHANALIGNDHEFVFWVCYSY
jgi:hypothetical protein